MPTAGWISFAFVVTALALVAAVPVLVRHRVHVLRREVTDLDDPARALANQFSIAIANESLARGAGPAGAGWYAGAFALERDAAQALDTLVRRLGAESEERFGTLEALAAA